MVRPIENSIFQLEGVDGYRKGYTSMYMYLLYIYIHTAIHT
jgi:hypothetical protein